MDRNGDKPDTNSMILDSVSPTSSNSRDMLDEPAAPRRNSTDDNDTSRPRKRPAVMAATDDQRETNMTSSYHPRYSEPNDETERQTAIADTNEIMRDEKRASAVSEAEAITEASRTLQIRAVQNQAGGVDDDGSGEADHVVSDVNSKPEDARKRSLSHSPELSNTLDDGSDTHTLRSTSAEVEEIEMDGNNDLPYQIRLEDSAGHVVEEYEETAEALARIVGSFEKSESPIKELEEIHDHISQFRASASGAHVDHFERLLSSSDLCRTLPDLVIALLDRNESFSPRFFQRSGLHDLTLFFEDFISIATLIIRHEASKLAVLSLEEESHLLSETYINTIIQMLRQQPLYYMISSAGFQIADSFPQLLSSFGDPDGFLCALKSLAAAIYQKAPSQPKSSVHLHLMPGLILKTLSIIPNTNPETKNKILGYITQFWVMLENSISEALGSHIQTLDMKDLLGRLDLYGSLAAGIHHMQPTNPRLLPKLSHCLASYRIASTKPKEIGQFVEWAHKFPFYYKMLCSSRMDIRLRGLTCMTDTLLSVWREYYSRIDDGSPILRFLVEYLIENGVLEYLVGPESHSELINRCGNVPAFLIVNQTIPEPLLNCLWQPVMDNKDPRIVKATLKMHQEMMSTMNLDHLAGLSKRISCLPFSSFDSCLMSFVAVVVEKIAKSYSNEMRQRQHLGIPRLCREPYEMLIRLMRLASEHDETVETAQTMVIFHRANEELSTLAEFGPEGSVRREILEKCVDDIKEMNGSVTGSTSVILAFLRRRPRNYRADSPTASEDVGYLVETFDLAALVVRETLVFIGRHGSVKTTSRLQKLRTRLELLNLMLRMSPNCVSKDLHAQLWTYLVGEKALGPSERVLGFDFYNLIGSLDSETFPLLDSLYREFLPSLDCIYFSCTPSVVELCKKSMEFLSRTAQPEDPDEDTARILHIAGADLLWRIILNANDEKLAAATIDLLVQEYLDSPMIMQASLAVIEATHLGIVDRCIDLLTSSATKLSRRGADDGDGDMTVDYLTEDEREETTRKYRRALSVLDQFVKGFRTRPFYASAINGEPPGPRGESLNITLRLCGVGNPPATHVIQLGSQNTAYDLHSHIYRLIVTAKHRIVLNGKELKLADDPSKSLKDFGIYSGCVVMVYIQRPLPAQEAENATGPEQPDVMRHFEALYTLLDLPEALSVKAWMFLNSFPPHDLVKQQLLLSETTALDIFPPDKPYKTLYSLHALRYCFEEQKVAQNGSTTFLSTCVKRLCEALTRGTKEREEQAAETQVIVTKEILERLKSLLQEVATIAETSDDIPPHPEDFVQYLLSLLQRCLEPPFATLEDVEPCITHAIYVLFECCHINPQVWTQTSSNQNLDKLIHCFLVNDSRPIVRECMLQAICKIYNDSERHMEFVKHFWPILSDILLSSSHLKPENAAQLFRVACSTFRLVGNSVPDAADLSPYFDDWFRQLCTHKVTETVGQPKEDHVVTGFTRLLTLCMMFMRHSGMTPPTNHLTDMWRNLLFPDSSYGTDSERMPILHDPTRAELYKFTCELVANNHESMEQIVRLNYELFPEDSMLLDEYWADRDRWLRAPAGLVGLHNLSNTCYLNSLLTQLFMNRSFQDFVLGIPVDSTDQMRANSFHLRVLFARMQASFAKAIEPRDLVESLRDFAGDPIDPQVQMDVDEFFNLLFDRLESEMPTTDLKSAFRSYYGGQLVQQVKSNECPHISERTEPFSAIQCDIKGKHTLQESLKAYVEGEIMEGDNKYRCTDCDRLVDAVKRTCLKDIPDHLICHLKRFDFDLQTMQRSKINERFEFPMRLDMKPYTIDHLSSMESGTDSTCESDEFELVGVLVHTGTAESGHYYSYIRDRFSPDEIPRWFEFNDSEVSLFDPSTIPENCYGGSDNISATGYVIPKSFSAYMLFYQRSSSLHRPLPETYQSCVPRRHRIEILRENEELIRRHNMFSPDYVQFVRTLVVAQCRLSIASDEYSSEDEVLQLALRAFEHIVARVKDFPVCEALVLSIEALAFRFDDCAKAFVLWASDSHVVAGLLMDNPFQEIRRSFIRMLVHVLGNLRVTNPTLYGVSDDGEETPIPRNETMLYFVCKGFCEAWNGLQASLKPWNDYFSFLIELANWGDCEKEYLLKAGVLRRILEMFVINHIGPTKRAEQRIEAFIKIMNKPRVPAAKPAELLLLLMKRCSPFVPVCNNEEMRDRRRFEVRLPLTRPEETYFKLCQGRGTGVLAVFAKLMEHATALNQVERIMIDILSAEPTPPEHEFTNNLKNTLLNGISVDPAIHAAPYLQCLQSFVTHTRSEIYIREIVSKVSEEIPTIAMTGGSEHLQFFQYIWSLVPVRAAVRPAILENISEWAPALVCYLDANVRESAEDFLVNILFDEPDCSPEKIHQAILDLAEALFQFITNKFPQNRQPIDDNTFDSTMNLLARCRDAQPDADLFNSKLGELRNFIDRLVIEEEEDIDLASDDWNGSDFGSDTRDMVHADEYRS